MTLSSPTEMSPPPRHQRLFELLRQQELANERVFQPPVETPDQTAARITDLQDVALASLLRERRG